MSDIIPFPRSKDKIIREIKQSFNQNDFDHKLFQIDCQQRGPFVIPIKKD